MPTPADVADVAAGTGILSRSLASRGYRTIAVEPNPAMRDEIRATDTTGELRTVNGTGEATGLPDNSVDLVTVAQAFHWLNPDTALNEFRRIGRTGALAAVVWNTRQFHATPFMRDYRALLDEHAPEYARMKMNWANLYDRVKTFFPGWTIESVIDNPQRWTRDELLGNLWSLSYVPQAGTEGHDAIRDAAHRVFDEHSVDDHVECVLNTIVVAGPVSA